MPTRNGKNEKKQELLHFRFTKTGFVTDDQGEAFVDDIFLWKQRFDADKWQALYSIGFEEKPKWLDAAGGFLYYVADAFQQLLTHQPDLELAREHVEITWDENQAERLLNAVPFTLGAEYVN